MPMQDQTQIEDEQLVDEQLVIDSIANATLSSPSFRPIHKVPEMLIRDYDDYRKYYVPKVVSIGPYHFGDKKLEFVEKLKPVFTMKLLSNNKETLRSLYKTLGEPQMVQELRSFYVENSTTKFCNTDFTKMMLQDCCFILYYILYIFLHPEECLVLSSHQLAFLHQDLFLLENQIPSKLFLQVMNFLNLGSWVGDMFHSFIHATNIFASKKRKPKGKLFKPIQTVELTEDQTVLNHFLHVLHYTLTNDAHIPRSEIGPYTWTSLNVNRLVDVGIHFKPSDTESLAHVNFLQGWWWFSAYVELPPITVDDSTMTMFLNLIAYEMTSHDAAKAWVTPYVCLLDSLIGHPEDVEVLRKAGVLEDCLGRDQEVVTMFKRIATGLVPSPFAYMKARRRIQRHYEIWKYTLISQIKHLYVKNPGLFFSYFGILALFLSAVQTYFTIWSPKNTCDDLCKFLKRNNHL